MNTTTTRPKCRIIPAEEYDGLPPIVFEDDKHRYILGNKGHFIRLRRKICFSCSNSAKFVVIFYYKKHNKVQRFCSEHASHFGDLPVQQQDVEEPQLKLTNREKLVIQRWGTQIKI